MEKRVRFNINAEVDVQLSINYMDERKLTQEQILVKYEEFLHDSEILKDKEIKYNRVLGIKTTSGEYWYISTAADKKGRPYEEVYFFHMKSKEVLLYNIENSFKQMEMRK